MMWSALYQQRPAPEEGDYFKAAWLRSYITAPATDTLAIYGASDYAVTADGGDYTVHVVVGVDPDGHMYLLDLWRKQAASDEWVEAFCSLVKEWKPREWAEEQGQIRAGVGPFLERMQRERQLGSIDASFQREVIKPFVQDPFRAAWRWTGCTCPRGASWLPDSAIEMLAFPAGKHDDIVDALGLIGQLLDHIMPGNKPEKPEKSRPRDEYQRFDFGGGTNEWMTA